MGPLDGFIDLGVFSGEFAYPVDINNNGSVLINAHHVGPVLHHGTYDYRGSQALIFNNGRVIELPRPETQILSGVSINESDQVVGAFSSVPGQEYHAFI
jgi:hypothetical protein